MPAKTMTDAWVRNCPIPPKPNQVNYFHTLQTGLSLVLSVSYGGSKTWRVLTYDANGKPKYKTLGKYGGPDGVSLADAMKMAKEYFHDPEAMEAQAKVGTFKDVAENWLRRYVAEKGLRTRPEIERCLAKYVYPQWDEMPFLDIKRRHVNELLDTIADQHGRTQADQVLSILRRIMEWQQTRDENYTSPIVRGMHRDKRDASDRARKQILTDAEIQKLWTVDGPFGAFLQLCLLTAQRKEKVLSMKRTDIDIEAVWTITSAAREKGNAGALKLPKMAIEIIQAQHRIAGNDFIFAGRNGKPIEVDWRKEKLDAELNFEQPWVIHDLRRTARSLMSRAGVSSEVAERVLGHTIAGVEGIYNRHAYTDEKAKALKNLASLIEHILNPTDNVIPLRA
jgi:integrase